MASYRKEFLVCFETESYYVDQAGLELRDLPSVLGLKCVSLRPEHRKLLKLCFQGFTLKTFADSMFKALLKSRSQKEGVPWGSL